MGRGGWGWARTGMGKEQPVMSSEKIPGPRLTGVKSHEGAVEQGGAAPAPLANRCAADGQVMSAVSGG